MPDITTDTTYDVIVVGLGVFGLSTCLELTSSVKQYSVLALDAHHSVPSIYSAATDLNKIIRAEYADLTYTQLAVEALRQWQNDPVFSKCYSQCGRLILSPEQASNQRRLKFEAQGYANLRQFGMDVNSDLTTYSSSKEIAQAIPWFSNNKLPLNVSATLNKGAGFAHTADSLRSVYDTIKKRLNIRFKFGQQGKVSKLAVDGSGIVSVTTADGKTYTAKQALIACGAATPYILDCKDQLHALGLVVTHIQLTEAEFAKYKDMPIFFSAERGYFFPPDPKTKLMKIALNYADFTNMVPNPFDKEKKIPLSLPVYTKFNSGLPLNGDKIAMRLLENVVPDLAYHKLIEPRICWISDTCNSNFLIDKVPNAIAATTSSNGIYVASGDSGHGAKFMPNIGKYIVSRLEGTLDEKLGAKWAWHEYPEWPKNGFVQRAKRVHADLGELGISSNTKIANTDAKL